MVWHIEGCINREPHTIPWGSSMCEIILFHKFLQKSIPGRGKNSNLQNRMEWNMIFFATV